MMLRQAETRTRKLLIVAGEASGDGHGAALVRELLRQEPHLEVAGLGGPRMAAAGVELLQDVTRHAMIGVAGALADVSGLFRAYRRIVHRLSSERPDAIVLIDFPEFNLMVAKHARRVGVPVLYYASPQVWAWRPGRVRVIARRVRKMLCFFEFERELYERAGVDVTCVGHPLLDALGDKLDVSDRAAVRRSLGLPESGTLIGLLPGSRRHEIEQVLPLLLKAGELIRRRRGDAAFVAAPADALGPERLRRAARGRRLDVATAPGRAHDVMLASDLLLVCSGTATLEAALFGTPMVVTYRPGVFSYALFGPLIRVRTFSLANIVAGRKIVPELYAIDATPRKVAGAALEILDGGLEAMREELAVVRRKLGPPGASARAAAEILKLL